MAKKLISTVDTLHDVLTASGCQFTITDSPIKDTDKSLALCKITHTSKLFTKPIEVDVVILPPGSCSYTNGSVLSIRIQLRISDAGIYSRFVGLPFTEKLKVINIVDNQLIGLNTRMYESNSNDVLFTTDHFISNELTKTNMYKQIEHLITSTLQLFDEAILTFKTVLESGTELFMVVNAVNYLKELNVPINAPVKDIIDLFNVLLNNHHQSIIYLDIAGLQEYIPFQNGIFKLLSDLSTSHKQLRCFTTESEQLYITTLKELYNPCTIEEIEQYNCNCINAVNKAREVDSTIKAHNADISKDNTCQML